MIPEKDVKDTILRKINSFCKNNGTKGVPIRVLHGKFITVRNNASFSLYEFEMGLLKLKKTVINKVVKNCIEFAKTWRGNTPYEAFINNREFVTKEFWDTVVKTNEETPVKDAENILKNDNDLFEEIKESLLAKTVHIERDAVLKKAPKKVLKKVLKEVPQKSHKDRLPVDWDKISLTKRMEFAKSIEEEDTEFKAYVLAIDSRISKYLSEQSTRKIKNPTQLYITLFSFSSSKTSPESKKLIKDFMETLNHFGRGRLQYVEILDPPIIEIREMR
jgi:hypothetical protein